MGRRRTALIVVSLLIGFALWAMLVALIGPLPGALFFLALAVVMRVWNVRGRRRRQSDAVILDRRWEGTTAELIEGYVAWCRLPDAAPADTPSALAWEGLHELVRRDPDGASVIMRDVADSLASNEIQALRSLGADALEELLTSDPQKYLATFERAAVGDERIAIALGAASLPEPWDARIANLRSRTEQPPSGL